MSRRAAQNDGKDWDMNLDRIMRLLKNTVTKWWEDDPWRLSAALSYYTLFSLAPLLTIAVALAAVVADEATVQGELLTQFENLTGKAGTETMANMLRSAGQPVQGIVATPRQSDHSACRLHGHV